MAFSRSPFPAPRPTRPRASVFAVGRQAYVALAAGIRSSSVGLTDDAGTTTVATLADGAEVAILGWRPGWADTTRYRVRTTDSGLEGWLAAGNLRATRAPVPPPVATPPAGSDPARRFGGRRV